MNIDRLVTAQEETQQAHAAELSYEDRNVGFGACYETNKILVLAPQPFYQDGRSSISLKTLLEILAADGHDLTAMVYPDGEPISITGCRLLRLPTLRVIGRRTTGFTWKSLIYHQEMEKMAARLLQKEKFDLLHAGSAGAIGMARKLGRQFHIPYVCDIDSSLPRDFCREHPCLKFFRPIVAWYERRAVRASAGVLAACKKLEQMTGEFNGTVPLQRLDDISLLPAEPLAEKQQKTDLGSPKGALTLMYVGSLQDRRGLDLLIEAFSLVCLDTREIRLIIIGGGRAEISRLRRKAGKLGVAGKVQFAGPRPIADLASCLAQADILVSPCTDGYIPPLELYSYLDSGRPVVATRLEMHTQVLDDSIAMLVEAEDSDMALGILRLVQDEELRASLAARAKQRVAEEYCREAYRRKLRGFLKMLRQHPSPA